MIQPQADPPWAEIGTCITSIFFIAINLKKDILEVQTICEQEYNNITMGIQCLQKMENLGSSFITKRS